MVVCFLVKSLDSHVSNTSSSYAEKALSIVQSFVDENLNSQSETKPTMSHRTVNARDKISDNENKS